MIKAVIQAGGKGTRMSSLTNNIIPKPMLEIDDKPILYHQIMNLKKAGIKEVIIIIGYLGNVIKNYFDNNRIEGINISYIEENPEKPLGTAGSLYYLKDKIDDSFIFLLGDIFIDIDLTKMINYHQQKKGEITLFTHPNGHPFDSDIVVVDDDNKIIYFDYKTNDRSKYLYNNLVNAGVMIFNKSTLDYITAPIKYNYERDIIEPLIKKGKVYSYKSTEYAKDIGTPERFERVKNDYYKGLPQSKNKKNKQQAIFIDIDYIIDNNNPNINLSLIELIKEINNSKYLCIGISNNESNTYRKKIDIILGDNGAYLDDLITGNKNELIQIAIKKHNIDMTKSLLTDNKVLNNPSNNLIRKLKLQQ